MMLDIEPGLVDGRPPRVVALGGGHGLAASLSAWRRITPHLTAVVTVADDGGSSGRLRRELGVLPPGDLRQALAALCGDDELGRLWRQTVQHRFAADGHLQGHALGNLLLIALLEQAGGDPVPALDTAGRLLGISGRVLPMCSVPLEIGARIRGAESGRPDEISDVRGQVAVGSTLGRVEQLFLEPANPPACPEAVAAVREADIVVLGPGSWFSSVLPHLMVPELADVLCQTSARRVVCLNLAPQPGETEGFRPEEHLDVLCSHAPDLRIDVVLADPATVSDRAALVSVARRLGADVRLEQVASADGAAQHDPGLLADAFRAIVEQFSRSTAGAAVEAERPWALSAEDSKGSVQAWP